VTTKKSNKRPAVLSHVDADGRITMVDVGGKATTARQATAAADIHMSPAAVRAIRSGAIKKGDPLQAARLAGIMAAKRTSDLIPLCHPLALTHVDVTLAPKRWGYHIEATARTNGQTGVEMEALTAASVAALTVYDMVKAVDPSMEITGVCLLEKRGGRSGVYRRLLRNGR
jgi:cyclic pyranopterin phosphate synthase